MNRFLEDVIEGLSKMPKRLNSKYFYDATGDYLFQKIMACDEYYLTRCEKEIFESYTSEIAETLKNGYSEFDLIELGAGDATKTIHVLEQLTKMKTSFTYVPIDISGNIIRHLEEHLPSNIPGLRVKGLNGEYLQMLQEAYAGSDRKKVILFLGSNIGNMEPNAALTLLQKIRGIMNEGDQVLIGFDLKKNPEIILAAYNDKAGYTKAFNLNLLSRINSELGGNFALDAFEHCPTYDALTGACKSYLVSTKQQSVTIKGSQYDFEKNEIIFMEVSQKYSADEIEELAKASGFVPKATFLDRKGWFIDTIWVADDMPTFIQPYFI
jgi:L-histidine Nalpha-methyltransferase